MKTAGKSSLLFGLVLALSFTAGWQIAGKHASFESAFAQSPGGYHTIYLPYVAKPAPQPPPPHTTPLPTTSYYFFMRYYTPAKARSLGCQLGARDRDLVGKQDSIVILDFGIPKFMDGQYGASGMMVGGFVTVDAIAQAVEEFGIGYWDCTDWDF